ncbi:TIGR03943 family putative permease subunit [Herbiconiux liukaitaii]|uniref:TIGR03943 family putative permease subunit n=1 Tax=Herbiconiux liukaitaii TaxID=3342799 RepID=UPI0035B8465C
MRERVSVWQGIVLCAVLVGATLWLAASGRLPLYIHPRYVEFTLAMALIAAVFIVAGVAFAWVRGRSGSEHSHSHGDHEHDDQEHHDHERGRGAFAVTGAFALAAATVLCLVIVPPATLSSATAADREMNAGAPVLDDDELISIGGDYTSFTVKDWASLLGQISSADYFEGASADVVGFVTPDSEDPENVYYVSRFIVTCCAVDAQPVGVPVFEPSWRSTLDENQWVHVSGPLVANPSTGGGPAVVVDPESVELVDEPSDPYVH